jgi:uroporphyrin-III C-methyltransferase
LTHRGLAQSVTFVTGHAAKDQTPDLDWTGLARTNHTVVVYMGLSTAPLIAARLMRAGRDAATPVLVVENASLAHEARVLTRLGDLATAVSALDGPAILIIGEVAAMASDLAEVLPESERAQA